AGGGVLRSPRLSSRLLRTLAAWSASRNLVARRCLPDALAALFALERPRRDHLGDFHRCARVRARPKRLRLPECDRLRGYRYRRPRLPAHTFQPPAAGAFWEHAGRRKWRTSASVIAVEVEATFAS